MNTRQELTANTISSRLKRLSRAMLMPAIAIAFGLVAGGIVIASSGHNPFTSLAALFAGGFGSGYSIAATLTRATPILFAGLAAALSWGSGYESMGIGGQMTLGAFSGAVVAANMPGPAPLVVAVSLLAGMLAGVAYSLLAAWISARFSIYLLIVTLMMNYVADNIASYMTMYVFNDPFATDKLAIQTQKIEGSILPRLHPSYTVHLGLVLALLCTAGILFMLKKTGFGYDARMNGMNPQFALYGGVNSRKNMYMVLALSGALAGLGGVCEALGTRYRFIDQMITSPGYAWGGITASLMSSNHPLGILASSVFLAGLNTGGASIELNLNIPREITVIIQGVLTLFVTAQFMLRRHKGKLKTRSKKGAENAA